MGGNRYRLVALEDIVGTEFVKSDPETISFYTVDGMAPRAVVFPESVEQISRLVKLAREEKWALLPWGSGSKIEMGNIPSRLDFVLCTMRLNRIIDMDTANLTVTAQAGVRFRDLQTALAGQEDRCYLPYESPVDLLDQRICSDREHMGCFLPMWPPYSDSATLGGIIASNSTGHTRLLYGLPRDMVLGVRYVAPSGEVIGVGGKTVKNVSGYDMCKLMIGSMGSLGVLCEMTFRLLPLPERVGTCLSVFPSLDDASRCVDKIFDSNLLPAAVEILNGHNLGLMAQDEIPAFEADKYAVAVALEGVDEAVERMASEIKEMATDSGAEESVYLKEKAHGLFWEAFSNFSNRLSKAYPEITSVRINYPISQYYEVIHLAQSLIRDHQLEYELISHAGSGMAVIHFLSNRKEAQAEDKIVLSVKTLLE
ncbi:MAG TPA: FAD-binding oxidoreductase, partial [Desulfobacterales bacterium]|nr:FAD-binding oxidoreductase [Desulfobacterales bacterium]